MIGRQTYSRGAAIGLCAAALLACGNPAAKEVPEICVITVTDTPPAVLQITGKCAVPRSAKPYRYNAVNILDGGELFFDDDNGSIDFWAKAIIVENGGKLTIGTAEAPIDTKDPKTTVTIHLYGPPQKPGGSGVVCQSN